jgi:predicted anti-sigma-YlaC factor YlaD
LALKNTLNLKNVTQQELNLVKEIAGEHLTMCSKFDLYSNQVQDQQFKQMLKQSSTDAKTTATNLINSI